MISLSMEITVGSGAKMLSNLRKPVESANHIYISRPTPTNPNITAPKPFFRIVTLNYHKPAILPLH